MAYEDYRRQRARMPLRPHDQSRNPDRRWSDSEYWFLDGENSTTLLMEVRGHGVVTMRATSSEDGLKFEGLAIVTKEEIWFDEGER